MNTICRTCGTTLQSEISRDYGLCGACRHAWEHLEDEAVREAQKSAELAKPAPRETRPERFES
ncbi:MAG: hypothetical protein ABI782_04335 [Anaerolineaceae bacterium]